MLGVTFIIYFARGLFLDYGSFGIVLAVAAIIALFVLTRSD